MGAFCFWAMFLYVMTVGYIEKSVASSFLRKNEAITNFFRTGHSRAVTARLRRPSPSQQDKDQDPPRSFKRARDSLWLNEFPEILAKGSVFSAHKTTGPGGVPVTWASGLMPSVRCCVFFKRAHFEPLGKWRLSRLLVHWICYGLSKINPCARSQKRRSPNHGCPVPMRPVPCLASW